MLSHKHGDLRRSSEDRNLNKTNSIFDVIFIEQEEHWRTQP